MLDWRVVVPVAQVVKQPFHRFISTAIITIKTYIYHLLEPSVCMGRTTVELDESVRNELRSFKADHGLTYDEAVIQLLTDNKWEFRHLHPVHGEK